MDLMVLNFVRTEWEVWKVSKTNKWFSLYIIEKIKFNSILNLPEGGTTIFYKSFSHILFKNI